MLRHLLSLSFLLLCLPCTAETVRMGFSTNKPPYILKGGGGIEVELVKAALRYHGHSLNPSYFEKKNLLQAIQHDRVNAIANVHGSVNDDELFYSQTYIVFQNYAISHLSSQCEIKGIKDLEKYRTVAWQYAHHHLGPEFRKHFSPSSPLFGENYLEHRDQVAQNRMFWQEKVEVIVVDKLLFEWHRAQLSRSINTDKKVVYHDIFQRPTEFKIGFKSEKTRNDFDAGLKQLRDSGRYHEIYSRFSLPQRATTTRATH